MLNLIEGKRAPLLSDTLAYPKVFSIIAHKNFVEKFRAVYAIDRVLSLTGRIRVQHNTSLFQKSRTLFALPWPEPS
jgi:hypothetical protein